MIFYDHTHTFFDHVRTGVQRVVKQLGYNLMAEIPSGFAPVILVGDTFFRCALDSAPRSRTLVRKFLGELDSVPVEALRRVVGHNEVFHGMKARLWKVLEGRRGAWPPAEMKRGDWYLTADAIWQRSEILSKVQKLRSAGIRTAVVHYDLIPLMYPEWVDRRLAGKFGLYAAALASFDVVFCISEFVRDEFVRFCRKHGHRVPDSVVTITLGHEIAGSSTPDGERNAPGTDRAFALCVGTLDRRKNQLTLLDAFDILWSRGVDLSLVIVGRPGAGSAEILSRIKKHPLLSSRLFYLPNCGDAELEVLYRRCAFTVLPSLLEGFGLPLVESMGRGKPCVCSDIPVFRETAGEWGVYFNPEDARSLASHIGNVYSDPERLESLVKRIRTEYSPPSWKDCARQVLEMLTAQK